MCKRSNDQEECIICLEPPIKPKRCSKCRKYFCQECIDDWLIVSDGYDCPHCRQEGFGDWCSWFLKLFKFQSLPSSSGTIWPAPSEQIDTE